MRPTLEELADARGEAIEFLAKNPDSELRSWLGVLIRATAPPTLDEALDVMVRHANNIGEWPHKSTDLASAKSAIVNKFRDNWSVNIRSQWATLTYFMGGAREP